jgi:DNA-binding transcriptional regulator PaaX
MASKTFLKQTQKHILKSVPAVNDYICATLWELGEATSQSFFSPKYSFTKPTRMLFGFEVGFKNKKISKNTIRKNLERLIAQGIVKKKGSVFSLSKGGIKLFNSIGLRKKILAKKWDGKYRLVIFDIPEKNRADRNWLRGELHLLQYAQLQKSVFISKFSLTEDIIIEIQKRKMSKFVNYLLVDKIFDYSEIKKK